MTRLIVVTHVWLCASGLAHAQLWMWAKASFPIILKRPRAVKIGLAVLVVLPTLARLVTNATHASFAAGVFAAAMTETMIVLIAALPLAAVRVIGLLVARWTPVAARGADERRITRRQAVERVGGAIVLGGTTATLGWGAIRGRYEFGIEEVTVRIVGLPRELDGYTIAQVSDLHVGNFVQEKELAMGLSLVKDVRADLIVVTGDLIDYDPAYIPMMLAALRKLEARDGMVAILGNHDYYAGAPGIAEAIRAAGIDMLKNEGRLLRAKDGGGFALLGVDDLWAARYGSSGPVLARAIAMVPEDRPRILLSHQPRSVDLWPGQVALQLSGHTHGGQVNPGFRPADFLMPYVSGRYEVKGTTLYVNRGFGVVGPPARVNAPPEITKIILVSA
jgi:uncharacterized protein